jgi:hypothetical protein
VNNDKYGFPCINKKTGERQAAGNIKRIHGFSTGDFVYLSATGKYTGEYKGRLAAITKRGFLEFKLKIPISTIVKGVPKMQNIISNNYKNFRLIQHGDSYEYH